MKQIKSNPIQKEYIILRIKENKLLLFGFFQTFILSSAISAIVPLVPLIADDLNVGLDFIGLTYSLSIFGLIIVSITTGSLIELIGLKKIMLIGLIISSIGTLGLFVSHTFSIFLVGYFLLQLGIGILTVCMLSIIGNFYPKNKVSSLMKVNFGHFSASIIIPLLVSLMLFLRLNWHYFFIWIFILQLILIIVLLIFKIPNKIKVENSLKTLFIANKKIISNPKFILCGIIVFFFSPVIKIFSVWFTSYFQNIGIDIATSSVFLSIFGVSLFLGMPIKNVLIKYFSIKKVIFFSFLLSFSMLIGILLVNNIILKIIFIFLFGCGVSGSFVMTFSISDSIFPEHTYTNFVASLLVTFGNLGVMVFMYLSGYLSEYYSKESMLYINILVLFSLIVLTAILSFNKKLSKAS